MLANTSRTKGRHFCSWLFACLWMMLRATIICMRLLYGSCELLRDILLKSPLQLRWLAGCGLAGWLAGCGSLEVKVAQGDTPLRSEVLKTRTIQNIGQGLQGDTPNSTMLPLKAKYIWNIRDFTFQELIEYARKWVANPGTPTISAACKMINRSHMAAALVFDFATKFDMQEHTQVVVDVTKAGMPEHAMVDVGMMSNYDYAVFRFSLDYM